jgi:hypothetical protein
LVIPFGVVVRNIHVGVTDHATAAWTPNNDAKRSRGMRRHGTSPAIVTPRSTRGQ